MNAPARRTGRHGAQIQDDEILIFDNLMDSKTILLTGNTSTMYALGFLDLLEDGPS